MGGSDRRAQVRYLEHVPGQQVRVRAQPVDRSDRVVERLARVIGGPVRIGGRIGEREEAVVLAEQQREVRRRGRGSRLGRLHEPLDRGRRQHLAALADHRRVRPQPGRQRENRHDRTAGGGDRQGDRALAAGARLLELARPALQLGPQQRAQPGRPLTRRAGAARIGQGQRQLAVPVHSPQLVMAPAGYRQDMLDHKLLGIYLNDHLAGSTVGVELAKRAMASNEGTHYGEVLTAMAA